MNTKKLLTTLCAIALLFSANNLKAQYDANCGIVIDGMMVDSIYCWNFENAGIVFPINMDKWKNYDIVQVKIFYRGNFDGKIIEYYGTSTKPDNRVQHVHFDKKNMDEWFADGTLGYWKVLLAGSKTKEVNYYNYTAVNKWYQVDYDGGWPKSDTYIQFEVAGHYKTGEKQLYDDYGNAYFSPVYDKGTILYQSKEYHVKSYTTQNIYQNVPKGVPGVDKKVPCTIVGKKFELKTEAVNYRNDLFIVKGTK